MPTLTLRIKKRPDATAMLTLVRADGSSTSGAIGPPEGYGPVHDLAHYVVERTRGRLRVGRRDARAQNPS